MRERKWLVLGIMVVSVAALAAAGCGSSSPSSPSATAKGKVVLKGVMLGAPTASGQPGAVSALAAGPGKITVTVKENTTITTTVSSNGTFELEGVPEGSFTLVFTSTTTVIGTITVPGGATQEINIVVNVTVNVVVTVKIEIDGHEVPVPHPSSGDNDD
ncbi:MAG TPA: hypothetical protein VKI41_10175 [Vicinamibacteria bacterium]|nr:hypothetical protein [Vicinamibacteria bacterium]